jgi:hypothetical protein
MKFKQIALALSLALVVALVASSAMASPLHTQTPGLSPSSYDFGDQLTGSTSTAQTVTLTNNDITDLNIGTLSVSGEFALSNDLCSGQVIASTTSCTFDVSFSPLSNGAKTGSVSIPSDSVTSPDSLSLSGVGVANTWYVATTGDNGNDCLSPGTPCATINGAITKATAGDTILVVEGTYGETVVVNKNIALSGGWDSSFISKAGHSIIDLGSQDDHGIVLSSILTISNFIIQNSDYGIQNSGGTLVFKNGALNNNNNGLRNFNFGGATFINATFSGNNSAGTAGSAISNVSGTITIYYSTITNNQGYSIASGNGSALINIGSSILSQNEFSCVFGSNFTSKGYNLFDSTENCVTLKSTDIQVTSPLILPLSPEGYHALLAVSPAIDHGNPANCPSTDQRSTLRPIGSGCDAGAYEGSVPGVASINSTSPNPTGSPVLNYTVKFSESVMGVDATDFSLTATGTITNHFIQSISGSGKTYTVAVNTGKGSGTIQLNLIDDDSIIGSSNTPLGSAGVGNGNFVGASYSIISIPTPSAPSGTIVDATPELTWNKIGEATNYKYEIRKGTEVIYSKTVNSAICVTNTCKATPTTSLKNGNYKWRVQALVNGQWRGYSSYKVFTISAPLAGYWKGGPNYSEFYITPDRGYIDNFSIYVTVYACNIYNQKFTYTPLVPLTYNKGLSRLEFGHSGTYYFGGFSKSTTTAYSYFGMGGYYWPGCGYLSGGPYASNPAWVNNTKPTTSGAEVFEFTVSPLPKDLMIPPTIFDLFNP